jgi:hypothetical protein
MLNTVILRSIAPTRSPTLFESQLQGAAGCHSFTNIDSFTRMDSQADLALLLSHKRDARSGDSIGDLSGHAVNSLRVTVSPSVCKMVIAAEPHLFIPLIPMRFRSASAVRYASVFSFACSQPCLLPGNRPG